MAACRWTRARNPPARLASSPPPSRRVARARRAAPRAAATSATFAPSSFRGTSARFLPASESKRTSERPAAPRLGGGRRSASVAAGSMGGAHDPKKPTRIGNFLSKFSKHNDAALAKPERPTFGMPLRALVESTIDIPEFVLRGGERLAKCALQEVSHTARQAPQTLTPPPSHPDTDPHPGGGG